MHLVRLSALPCGYRHLARLPRAALLPRYWKRSLRRPYPGFDFQFQRLLSIRRFSTEKADEKKLEGGKDKNDTAAPEVAFSQETAATDRASKQQKEKQQKLLFPWRHEQDLSQISPQLEQYLYYDNYLGWREKLFHALWHRATAYLLETPWYKLVGDDFKRDLEDPVAWAFTRAVGGVLSNVYQVPLEDIYMISMDDNAAEVNFQYTSKFPSTATSTKERGSKFIADAMAANASNQQDDRYCVQVREMMDPKLYNLFRKAHARENGDSHDTLGHSPPPLEIILTMKPIEAELRTLRCFPFLSRAVVEEDPSRRKTYVAMITNIREMGLGWFLERFWAFADQMLSERGQLETTASADFVVHCRETFQVRDLSTNEIIQGDGQGRIVTHVVRMEKDFAMIPVNDNKHYIKLGNWKIVDIDDLLGGNTWIFD